MKYTYLLLSAVIILFTACDKDSKENKCLNGGYETLDYCICPDGYSGSLCELGLADYFTGTYKGSVYQTGSTTKTGSLYIERHPNNDPHFIQIFLEVDGTKQYITDSKVISQIQILLKQDFDDGTSITTQGGRSLDVQTLSLSIIYRAINGSQKTTTFSGTRVN